MGRFIKGFFKSILLSFGQVILIVALLVAVLLVGQRFIGGFFDDVGASLRGGLESFAGLFDASRPDISGIILPEVEPIQALSSLTVTRFNYSGIVVSETAMPGILQRLYGDNLVLVAVVQIEAGVEMGDITANDLQYDEETNTLRLQIPPARLQNCFLNDSASYVASRSTGIFARTVAELDTSARRFALHQFRDEALEMGILTTAQERAEEVTVSFIRLFMPNDVNVEVVSAPAPQPPLLADTCR